MQNKTLIEWLSEIEKHSNHIHRPHLEHLKIIANRLDIWPISTPVITVTGTNGKGSCVALLNDILQNAGYKIGKYTSPHLLRYHERIICNNQTVTDQQLCEAFSLIEKNKDEITLNYFEWTTLAALIIFKQQQLDAWILEVGVGGRLDPVNIIDADLAIISTIAIDHVNWLGNTREQIGQEKAAIMRAQKPAICGDDVTPFTVKKYAQQIGARLFCQTEHFTYQINDQNWSWRSNTSTRNNLPLPHIEIQNAATVLAAVEQLAPYFQINEQAIHTALQNTYLPGRYQKIVNKANQIFDVAHNPAAAQLLANKLKKENGSGRIIAVVAMLNDKDHAGTISPLVPLITEWYAANLNTPRGTEAKDLARVIAEKSTRNVFCFHDVLSAYEAALKSANPNDTVVVFGSFYIVAEVLRIKGASTVLQDGT